jgi:hypothetical protein
MPQLERKIEQIADPRMRHKYSTRELLMGCIAMHLFKSTSRNHFNNLAKECNFKENYQKLFKLRLPSTDTIDDLLCKLEPAVLASIKKCVIQGLIQSKQLSRYKLLNKYYLIAVDGTGVSSFGENNLGDVLTSKTSKNNKVTYSTYALEAKLVTRSGLCFSIGTEWIENEEMDASKKQDCEKAAFARLTIQIKKAYPQLPICILADGLYPDATLMEICKSNNWKYIVVLKDGNLSCLQDAVAKRSKESLEIKSLSNKGKRLISQSYQWIKEHLFHKAYENYWFSLTETVTDNYEHIKKINKKSNVIGEEQKKEEGKKSVLDTIVSESTSKTFVWLSNICVNRENIAALALAGRDRWKIENEGFNVQKNGGYCLAHKFSNSSIWAYKNYYQCLQIAHIIGQLIEHSKELIELKKKDKKQTNKNLWEQARNTLTHSEKMEMLLSDVKENSHLRLE